MTFPNFYDRIRLLKIEKKQRIIYSVKQRRNQMKSTGVVRKVDELGRIVLPISIRQTMDINEKDSLEIFTDENRIILQKYQPSCIFCNNADDVVFFNGKRVCEACLKKIKETF